MSDNWLDEECAECACILGVVLAEDGGRDGGCAVAPLLSLLVFSDLRSAGPGMASLRNAAALRPGLRLRLVYPW